MKKLLALILAAALALSLVACGGDSGAGDTNTPSTGNGDTTSTDTPSGGGEDNTQAANSMTKEEMLEVAELADLYDIHTACFKNVLSAKQTYCGKVLEIKAQVNEIKSDSIIFTTGQTGIIVLLPEEDILNIKRGQWITIVGMTDDDIIEETNMGLPYSSFTMKQAYLVADRYEYTGTPKSKNSDFNGAWNVEFPNSRVQQLVYFDESIDVTQYVGKEITFSAKNIDGKYYDIIIIE